MPSEATLKSCFIINPDGAGYMFPTPTGVHIKKGYMTFKEFYEAVMEDYEKDKDKPFVMHFRIGTQGGNIPANTHPFPLSDEIDDLKVLDIMSSVGIAHNGIIRLTSTYSLTTTSDTMDFITDYLSLIIKDNKWYEGKYFDKDKLLIERLIGGYNKLAIMSEDGHTELIGDFHKDGECYYSNLNHKASYAQYNLYNDYDIIEYAEDKDESDDDYTLDELYEMGWSSPEDYRDVLDSHYNKFLTKDGWFDFNDQSCPSALEGDYEWCTQCLSYAKCHLGADKDFNKYDCRYGNKCSKCKYKHDCVNSSDY